MEEEDKVSSSSPPAVSAPRARSLSVGTMPGNLQGDGRLQARLQASFVGLEELSLLRQTHCRAIESAKAILMANIPEEDLIVTSTPTGPPRSDQTVGTEVGAEDRLTTVQETTQTVGGAALQTSNKLPAVPGQTSPCRKRANSMDMSVAKSLALTAKKLARIAPVPTVTPPGRKTSHQEYIVPQGEKLLRQEERRIRSSSFSAQLGTSRKQMGNVLKKGQSLSVLVPKPRGGGESNTQLQNAQQDADTSANPDSQFTSRSLSGSFLSLGSLNSPKHHRSWTEVTYNELLSERDFDNHFKSARSLSGSNLKYEFPSPMHAILLHYDKTTSPVLSHSGNISNKLDENKKMRRASFSGPVGRRISRQEMTYKLRKDSSLGDLPLHGNYTYHSKLDLAEKASENSESDQGISAFIEMLASRGQAKRRQEDRDRKQRMLDALVSAKQKVADPGSTRVGAGLDTEVNISQVEPSGADSAPSTEGDSGQWDDSNLSSSGKRGSHVSIRSSASSKASLSSEEGYYSHPGSPQNQHAQNRFSIQSSASLASAGSFSFYQGEFSDEDLLESPLEKLQACEVPESPTSSETMTPSSCGTVEILDLPHSPGAKRRASAGSPCSDSTAELASTNLPRTSTPITDTASRSASLPRRTADQGGPSQAVTITVTRPKSSSPIDIERKQRSDHMNPGRALSASPRMSFLSSFEMRLSPSSSRKSGDLATISVSPKKDSPSWGKLLPDPPRLSSCRQVATKGDSPVGGRSRFEGPRTPTIQEEPTKEEQLSEPAPPGTPPALQPLSVSPARDNVAMQSPTICKAPKVPSWRKLSKVSTAESDENCQQTAAAVGPALTDDTNMAVGKRDKVSSHGQSESEKPSVRKHSTSVRVNLIQSKSDKKECEGNKKRVSGSQIPSDTHEKVGQKKQPSSIKITVKNEPKEGSEAKVTTRTVHVNRESSVRKVRSEQKEKAPDRSTPRKALLQPPPGREYISRNPKSDANNVFQYPAISATASASPKAPTAKDIQEILKNWVEARTPNLTDGKAEVEKKTDQSVKASSTLPRGFHVSGQPLTPTLPLSAKGGIDNLHKAKRMYHSQELYPKDARITRDIHRLSALNDNKQHQLNLALNTSPRPKTGAQLLPKPKASRSESERPDKPTVTQQKAKIYEHPKPGSCDTASSTPSPPSQTVTRPRSQTWSRGQPVPAEKSNRNAWVREIVVPPSTPTCKTEAKIYEGRTTKTDILKKSDNEKDNSNSRLHWFKTSPEIKDTFV